MLDEDDRKVALLAALHSNFSESFDTRSVFETFAGTIKGARARRELMRLAQRVARRQAEFIKAAYRDYDEGSRSARITLVWPEGIDPDLRPVPSGARASFWLQGHRVTVELTEPPARYQRREDEEEVPPARRPPRAGTCR